MGGKQISNKNAGGHVNQTTLGTNSYNKGLFSTIGSVLIPLQRVVLTVVAGRIPFAYGAQNFGATVLWFFE